MQHEAEYDMTWPDLACPAGFIFIFFPGGPRPGPSVC